MNREIKFRAWNERKGWKNKDGSDCVPKMEYKDFVIYPDGRKEFPQGGWDLSGCDEEMILMQYTGLKDKNGKEIYEGDILSFPENDEFIMEMSDVTKPVIYERGAYRVDVFDWFKKVLDDETALEGQIVGNVYENPELLSNKE